MTAAPFRPYLKPMPWQAAPLLLPPAFTPDRYDLFKVITPETAEGLFTGYYEPELAGAFAADAHYRYPVYRTPLDPTRFSRAEIAAGALAGQGLELLYCADPVDLFFMHIQGSGAIKLPDGRIQRVGFAAKNGRPYTAIGRVLKEQGALAPPVTMQAIRDWLQAHPEKRDVLLHTNESFIFFRLLDGPGPVGAAGHVLKAEESLAVDDAIWPFGLDVIVETRDPLDAEKSYVRLMKTADKGSAIKGVIRGDIFFGHGALSAKKAGAMQQKGCLWVLLPKE